MKGVSIILIALVVAGGCIQTPAKVASGMPAVLKNVSNDVNNVTGSIEKNLTFAEASKSIDEHAKAAFNLSVLRGN
jgi:hypothetical protein